MIKKQPYTAPEAETLVVRFEGVLCGSPNEYYSGGAGEYGVGDTNDNGSY